MNLNKYFSAFLCLCFVGLVPKLLFAQQLVNMEETWQEFLGNQKTSNVSKLVKPEKSQPANYT